MAEERPRFRRDLVATPLEADGVAYVEATDPRTGTAFRFYAVEHAVAETFDGRPLPEVISGARERSGLPLTVEQLKEFAQRLTELGFLENGHDESRTREMPPLDSAIAATAPDAPLPGDDTPADALPEVAAASADEAVAEFAAPAPTLGGASLDRMLADAGAEDRAAEQEQEEEEQEQDKQDEGGKRASSTTVPFWPPPPPAPPPAAAAIDPGTQTLVDVEVDAESELLAVIAATAEGKSDPNAVPSEPEPDLPAPVQAAPKSAPSAKPATSLPPLSAASAPSAKPGPATSLPPLSAPARSSPFPQPAAPRSSPFAAAKPAPAPPTAAPAAPSASPPAGPAAPTTSSPFPQPAAAKSSPFPQPAPRSTAPAPSPARSSPFPQVTPPPSGGILSASVAGTLGGSSMANKEPVPLPPEAAVIVADTLAGFPPQSDPSAEARQDTPRLFSRIQTQSDNAVTGELGAFVEPEPAPVASLRSLEPADEPAATFSSPPPIGTPQKPLTEETAMPPVLPLGSARETAAEEPAPTLVTAQPAAAVVAPRPADPGRAIPLRPGLEATIPDGVVTAPMGPAPESRPITPRRRAISARVYAALGLVTAAVVGALVYRSATTTEPTVLVVRTVMPQSSSVFRWFDAVGTVKPAGERTLPFSAAGKVASVLPIGSAFHSGDVIAELEGAKRWKSELAHHQDRLSHYEKMLETARASDDRPEIRQDDIKVTQKKRLVVEAQGKLAREQVLATAAGEVAETLVAVGATVKPGAGAVRTKGTDWRAEVELSREEADRLRQLGFCHLEIDGKPLEGSLAGEGGDETHVAIDLPADPAVSAGKPVRVARARFDGVLVLPVSALVPSKGPDHRVFVAKDGHAESTAVILADQTATDIVVSQGLEPGSAVILDPPRDLRPRDAVRIAPR